MEVNWDEKTYTINVKGETTLNCSFGYLAAKTINVDGKVLYIPSNCFSSYSKLEHISLPDSVISIGNNFIISTKIKEFKMPLGITEFPSYQPFDYDYELERFIVDNSNPAFTAHDDALYSKDMTILYFYPGGRKCKSFIIPEGVNRVFNGAFSHSRILEEIIIPTTITTIDSSFAYYIISLKRVVVLRNEKDNLNSTIKWNVDSTAFAGAKIKFENVTWIHACFIPMLSSNGEELSFIYNIKCNNNNNEYSINNTIFSDNSQIKSIAFDYGLSTVGSLSFSSMTSLQRIHFPNTLKSIEFGAFKNSPLKKRSCISYSNSIVDILKPHFSRFSLGLNINECTRKISFDSIATMIILII